MALSLIDRTAVRLNIVPRCTAFVVNYALYLLGFPVGGATSPRSTATQAERTWALQAMLGPAYFGDRASWHVIDQPAFIDKGSAIDDDTLKGAVETAINNRFIGA